MYVPISANWKSHHSSEFAARYRARGDWLGLTLRDFLTREVEADPLRLMFSEEERAWRVEDIFAHATALATSLHELGIQSGDVISFQLPNWTEAVIIDCAAAIGGFVCNPIVLNHRSAELRQILADCQSKAIFVPSRYRDHDYEGMISNILVDIPHLQHIITVRGQGKTTFEALVDAGGNRPAWCPDVDPDSPKMILFTSGTTGRAKGVVHSHNSFHCELEANRKFWSLGRSDCGLVTGPVGHMAGYLYACNGPLQWGTSCALVERWDAHRAADLIERLGVTFSVGPPVFLQDLINVAEGSNRRFPSLRLFVCGGASVPPAVISAAFETFANCVAFRSYGSTEAPTTTLGIADPSDVIACANTDGEVYNNEVRIVDEQGNELPPGGEGEVLIRGPECMLGYANEADNAASYDGDNFWKSGDLGRIDKNNRLTITGRKKDLIIRGGENISAREIEDALHVHSAVLQAAAVSAPHPRLGETVFAFIVLRQGCEVTHEQLLRHLEELGLAKYKWPEQVRFVNQLPLTAYGKVRKNVLRDELRTGFAR